MESVGNTTIQTLDTSTSSQFDSTPHIFNGTPQDTTGYSSIHLIINAEKPGILRVKHSVDASGWDIIDTFPYPPLPGGQVNTGMFKVVPAKAGYCCVQFENTSNDTNTIRLQTMLVDGTTSSLEGAVIGGDITVTGSVTVNNSVDYPVNVHLVDNSVGVRIVDTSVSVHVINAEEYPANVHIVDSSLGVRIVDTSVSVHVINAEEYPANVHIVDSSLGVRIVDTSVSVHVINTDIHPVYVSMVDNSVGVHILDPSVSVHIINTDIHPANVHLVDNSVGVRIMDPSVSVHIINTDAHPANVHLVDNSVGVRIMDPSVSVHIINTDDKPAKVEITNTDLNINLNTGPIELVWESDEHNQQLITAANSIIYTIYATNFAPDYRYLKLYNKAGTIDVDADKPRLTIPLPADIPQNIQLGMKGLSFPNGIQVRITRLYRADDQNMSTAGDVGVTVMYEEIA